MQFDMIITNPPYAIANSLTTSIVNNIGYDSMISLMPISGYRRYQIYSNIEKCKVVDSSIFNEAAMGNNLLSICVLKKNKINKYPSFDDLELCTYRPELKKYYAKNSTRLFNFIISGIDSTTISKRPEKETDFYIHGRALQTGVQPIDNNIPYKYNCGEMSTDELLVAIRHPKYYYGGFIYFNTPEEKNNFQSFWYNDPLMHKLLLGLNKCGGSFNLAIPRVDWSHTWTGEELLKDYGYTDKEIEEVLR